MFSIPFSHKGGNRVAVADVGSGSAGVAILSFTQGEPAKIIAAHRITLPFEERAQEATTAGIISALNESAEKTLAAARTLGFGPVESSHAVIHAPWVRSKTVSAVKEFPSDQRVNAEEIAVLAKEALAGEKEFNHRDLIEANVVRVELNGYPTAYPNGKHAHVIFAATLVSECQPRIKTVAQETLVKVFSLPPTFHSGTKALLTLLRGRSASHTNYLIIDMASEATILGSAQKGAPIAHALVLEGTHTILKRIAGNGMPEETSTLMRMLARDHCEDSSCEELKVNMAHTEQELVRIFGEAFSALAESRKLPRALVLVAESSMTEWLSLFFSRIDFTQFTLTTQPFSVEILTHEDLQHFVASNDPNGSQDIGLLVASSLIGSNLEGER